MTRSISLTVNNMEIDLDYFVAGYLDRVTGGIIESLRDTGDIGSLKLDIDNQGQVTINLNGAGVPLTEFPVEIIRSTVLGMIAPLKGVPDDVRSIQLTLER